MTPPRTLVTGFLGFGRFTENPSAELARSCGREHELVEVAYEAADALVTSLITREFDHLVMLGVCGRAAGLQHERIARNHVGAGPDVRGVVRGPGMIEPDGPAELRGSLPIPVEPAWGGFSDDAGAFLCNYTYYRALRQMPQRSIGFVHVPPVDVLPIERQREGLHALLEWIERASLTGWSRGEPQGSSSRRLQRGTRTGLHPAT